jgi:hypothetical protein
MVDLAIRRLGGILGDLAWLSAVYGPEDAHA